MQPGNRDRGGLARQQPAQPARDQALARSGLSQAEDGRQQQAQAKQGEQHEAAGTGEDAEHGLCLLRGSGWRQGRRGVTLYRMS